MSSTRIDSADIDLQTIKDRVAFCRLTFLEYFSIELLHQEHGGPASKNVGIAAEFLPCRAGSKQGNNFFLRQRRFARKHCLRGERAPIDIHADGVIANQGGTLEIDPGIE